MSAPKRYTAAGEGVVRTDTDGTLVSFEDYASLHYERIHDLNQIGGLQEENARLKEENARLKDENERLRSFCTRTIIPNIQLQAEVERLTDAITRGASTPDAHPHA